jgi:hypothetical protein
MLVKENEQVFACSNALTNVIFTQKPSLFWQSEKGTQ